MSSDDIAALVFFALFYGLGALVVLVLVGQILWARWVRQRVVGAEGLAAIAALVGGEVARDPSTAFPFVRLQLPCGRAYFLYWVLSGHPERVVSAVEIRVGSTGFLEATSDRSRRYPSRGPRLQEIRDAREFRFITGDPVWARRLLDGGVESFLQDLKGLFHRPIRLQVSPGRMTLDVEAWLSAKQAAALVREAERLVGLLRGPADDAGIQIVEERFEPSVSLCPVCRLETSETMVLCRGCRVPHHSDCWSYAGRCAILGCGSRDVG